MQRLFKTVLGSNESQSAPLPQDVLSGSSQQSETQEGEEVVRRLKVNKRAPPNENNKRAPLKSGASHPSVPQPSQDHKDVKQVMEGNLERMIGDQKKIHMLYEKANELDTMASQLQQPVQPPPGTFGFNPSSNPAVVLAARGTPPLPPPPPPKDWRPNWREKMKNQSGQADMLNLARQIVDSFGGKEFRRAMLCLVGEGRSGKTALSHSLSGKVFSQTSSTVGIGSTQMEISTTNLETGKGGGQWKSYQQRCELDEAKAYLAASRIRLGKTDTSQQKESDMLDLLRGKLGGSTLDKQEAGGIQGTAGGEEQSSSESDTKPSTVVREKKPDHKESPSQPETAAKPTAHAQSEAKDLAQGGEARDEGSTQKQEAAHHDAKQDEAVELKEPDNQEKEGRGETGALEGSSKSSPPPPPLPVPKKGNGGATKAEAAPESDDSAHPDVQKVAVPAAAADKIEPAAAPPPSVAKLNEELVLKYLNDAEIDDPVKLCMWDFGGQDVFYSLHHLFLKRFAVYLVCFNMEWLLPTAKDEVRASCLSFLRFWLNSCAVHAVDVSGDSFAPVMLVGTHKDVVTDPAEHETISDFLWSTFHDGTAWRSVRSHEGQVSTGKGTLWFYPVDNTKSAGDIVVQQLMGDVQKCILEEEYTKRKVPFSWLGVYDKISSNKRPSIPLNQFQDIAWECGLPTSKSHTLAEECLLLLKLLGNLGVVMHHDEDDLRDLVILNPAEFLAAPASKIICQFQIHDLEEHREARAKMAPIFSLLTKHGVLDRRLLAILWRDFREQIKELEILLVKFGLIIPLMQGLENSKKGEKGADSDAEEAERYLVPAVLHKRALTNFSAHKGFILSCYCVFAERGVMREWVDAHYISSDRVSKEGFLPSGVFARILGKAVVWCQYTTGSAVSELDISAYEASLSFGQHFLTLQELPEENRIRLLLFTQRPLVVIDALRKQIDSVISECVPNLRFAFCVPQDAGFGLSHTEIGNYTLVFLDGHKGLTTADAKGAAMQIGRGPSYLVSATHLRQMFAHWLPPLGLRAWYDVFISYRWGKLDSDLAEALFALLSKEIVPEDGGRGVEVFRDRERLERGRSFQKDFVQALLQSAGAVPLVSHSALQRMLTLVVDSDVDNVLLEWTVIVELFEANRLIFCLPIILGEETEAAGDTRSVVSNIFAAGVMKRLPDVVCSKVVAMAESLLKNEGIEPSASLYSRTVRQTVEKVASYLGVLAWDVTLSHGGGGKGGVVMSSAHSQARLKGALFAQCAEAVMERVRKASADARHPRRSASSPDHPQSPEQASPQPTSQLPQSISTHLLPPPYATWDAATIPNRDDVHPASRLASRDPSLHGPRSKDASFHGSQESDPRLVQAVAEAEVMRVQLEKAIEIAALQQELAKAQMAATKAEADARVAKAQFELQLMQAKAQSACCTVS